MVERIEARNNIDKMETPGAMKYRGRSGEQRKMRNCGVQDI